MSAPTDTKAAAAHVDYLVMDSRAIDDFDEAICHEVCSTLGEAKRRAPEHGDFSCVFSLADGLAPAFEWQHIPARPREATP